MAGILNKKQRVLDTIITERGRMLDALVDHLANASKNLKSAIGDHEFRTEKT